jgi:N-methylhydantoinase B
MTGRVSAAAADPVRLEIWRHLFQAAAEEMGETLRRTGLSPNIKERRDYSCAVFDSAGKTIAQAEHMPVHLGSMPASVAQAIADCERLEPGDAVILNDPYRGGTHLPDVTIVQGVFAAGREQPVFYVANRAHHADIGGISPGSLPIARELYQEGVIIPPLKVMRRGVLNRELIELFVRNVRTPEERRGDLAAQFAANAVGERRLLAYVAEHGLEAAQGYGAHLQDYAERMTRALIRGMPDGAYTFADRMDDDGQGTESIGLRVRVEIRGDEAVVDFAGSAPACAGSVNAVRSITQSATFYAFRTAIGEDVPSNEGGFRPLTIRMPEDSIVDARPPHAVSAGNVETSQRIVDVVLGALAQALPDRIPAAGQGTMNNLTFGGTDRREQARPRPFAYYETIGGGAGAGPGWRGTNAVHVHMSNTMNTPVEAFEREFPIRIRRYAVRRGSGGAGRYAGGDGIVRAYEFLAPAAVTIVSERRRTAPYGLAGGGPGTPGRNRLRRAGGGEEEIPGKWQGRVEAGDVVEIATPGGGGWGEASGRQDGAG